MVSREGPYKTGLRHRIEALLPGCVIVKLDSADLQGIPDMLILYLERWAVLEVKISPTARVQPNQEYWIGLLGAMSFSAFINPENESEVLDALYQSLQPR
jgi:hypothetical protein